jgi:isopenicillin N synthase-like dioxygenase
MASNPVPVVDFDALSQGSQQDRKSAAKEIDQAFQELGFVMLQNHGIPKEAVEETFEWSQKFFALPADIKAQAPHPPGHTHHRGWSGRGQEKTSQHVYGKDELRQLKQSPDIKETFESGNPVDKMQPNIWLREEHLPGFRAHMESFFKHCDDLVGEVLRALAIALDLQNEHDLSSKHSKSLHQLRLAYYPSIAASLLQKGTKDRCSAHSDFGTMTLLFQDSNGGLEIENPRKQGSFLPVPPLADTVIVNCGDLMERWSNGRWRSGVHRVVAPPVDQSKSEAAGEEILRSRYSIPFFAAADPDALIEPLPGCWDDADRPKKYDPITTNEYVMMRMAAIR